MVSIFKHCTVTCGLAFFYIYIKKNYWRSVKNFENVRFGNFVFTFPALPLTVFACRLIAVTARYSRQASTCLT